MFAANDVGTLLPPFIVYKSEHLYDTWLANGPKATIRRMVYFNCSSFLEETTGSKGNYSR